MPIAANTSAKAHARCEDCHRVYAVPDPERSYSCKVCHGTVTTVDEALDKVHLEDLVACPHCEALNNPDAVSCIECHAIMPHHAPGHRVRHEATEARHEAIDALKRGQQWIGAVRWLYRIGALTYGLVTLFAILALQNTDVPQEAGIVFVGLTTLLTVMMMIGAMRIDFEPFPWTVTIATVATGVAVVHVFGPNPLGLAFPLTFSWAVLLWAAFIPTQNFQRLMKIHQDRYILHHASQSTRRSLKGRTARERHERLVRAMRNAGLKAWKSTAAAAALALMASGFSTYGIVTTRRPPLLDPVRTAFEQAWTVSDVEAVGSYLIEPLRDYKIEWLSGVREGLGWDESLPKLARPTVRGDEATGYVEVDYKVDQITLATAWSLKDRSWTLTQLELPRPPFEGTLQRFLDAWKTSNPQEIVAFYSPENRADMLPVLERSTERLGWVQYPDVLGTKTEVDDRYTSVNLRVQGGEVTTRWHFRRDGRWGLNQLRFPR